MPFERISEVQTLKKSLKLKAALQPVLRRAVLSVGKLIELRDDFREMKEDPFFLSEITSTGVQRFGHAHSFYIQLERYPIFVVIAFSQKCDVNCS